MSPLDDELEELRLMNLSAMDDLVFVDGRLVLIYEDETRSFI